jgi:hypothetical protein
MIDAWQGLKIQGMKNDGCMERVKHLQKRDDKHMKMITCL